MGDKIRFAPLVRVSTEKQEDRGASIASQKRAIIKAVSLVDGGYIPDHCWIYCGQEHATPDYERQIFAQLMADASNRPL